MRWRAWFAGALVVQLVVLYWPRAVGDPGLPGADKAAHLLIFALAAWTGRRAGVPVAVLAWGLGVHAVLSELVQAGLLPGRSGDPWDVVADLAGVAVGLAVARLGRR